MSMYDPDPDPQNHDDGQGEDPDDLLKRLRKDNRQKDQEIARLKTVERELAFQKAGLDLKNPLHATVAKGYEGELETAKITDWATTLGILEAQPPATPGAETVASAAEQAQTQERNELANNAPADTPQTLDPKAESLRRAEEIMKGEATREDAMAAFITMRSQAALAGDDRVIVPKGQYY